MICQGVSGGGPHGLRQAAIQKNQRARKPLPLKLQNVSQFDRLGRSAYVNE